MEIDFKSAQDAGETFLQSFAPASVVIADMNNDGAPDLVIGDGQYSTLELLNDGHGDFTVGPETYTDGSTQYDSGFFLDRRATTVVGDLNGDGRQDIVTAGFNRSNSSGDNSTNGVDVLLNASPDVLPATSDPVVITRSAVASPVLQEVGDMLTQQSATSYMLDLGAVAQGSAAAPLTFTLTNAAPDGEGQGPSDALGGVFQAMAAAGFKVAGTTLPGLLRTGESYSGLTVALDTTAAGQHTQTITFAGRDSSDTTTSYATVPGTDTSVATTTSVDGANVAAELPPLTLTITETVTPGTAPAESYAITGTAANTATTGGRAVNPFAATLVTNSNPAAIGTATVRLVATGHGVLSAEGGGSVAQDGATFTVSGTPDVIAAALQLLVFTPVAHQVAPGEAVSTALDLTVDDGVSRASASTAVAATAINTAPAIAGAQIGQAITDQQTLHPFATVTLTDPDPGAAETTTITLSGDGTLGTLSGAGLTLDGSHGYVLATASPASEQAMLRALLFTPAMGTGTGGNTVTNQATLRVSDGIDTATDAATSIVVTQASTGTAMGDVHMVTLDGLHYEFQADGDYTLVRSTVSGDPFDIQVRTEAWAADDSSSLTTQVAARVGGTAVDVRLDGSVSIDGVADTALDATHPVQQLAEGTLTALGGGSYHVGWASGEGLTVTNEGFFLNLHTTLAATDGPGSVQGLLGTLRGPANDLALPDGMVLAQPVPDAEMLDRFARAWQVGTAESMLDGHVPVQESLLGLPNAPSFLSASAPGKVLTGSLGSTNPVTVAGTLATLEGAAVMNLAGRDVIDVTGAKLTDADIHYAPSGSGGTLSLTDGTAATHPTPGGSPALATFQTASDLHGGTLIQFG